MKCDQLHMHGIAYLSNATSCVSSKCLENILTSSRSHNERHNITGVLLCYDSVFFQYIEGPKHDLEDVYEKIKQSKMHYNIMELLNQQIPKREFEGWAMGFSFVPQSFLLELEHAKWGSIEDILKKKTHPTEGVSLLLSFVKSFR